MWYTVRHKENNMKIQIRRSVFETNSSSVHSITMCSKDDFEKWENNSNYYFLYRYNKSGLIGTKEEMIKMLKSETWRDGTPVYSDVDWDNEVSVKDLFVEKNILTSDEYFDRYNEYLETFVEYYTTPKGEDVVAFGYYGYDG